MDTRFFHAYFFRHRVLSDVSLDCSHCTVSIRLAVIHRQTQRISAHFWAEFKFVFTTSYQFSHLQQRTKALSIYRMAPLILITKKLYQI